MPVINVPQLAASQLLNRQHSLAKPMRGFWVAGAGPRGATWHDLTDSRIHGSLEGGPTWSSDSPPGGFGSLAVDGVNQYNNVPFARKDAAGTVACWIKKTNNARTDSFFFIGNDGSNNDVVRFRFDGENDYEILIKPGGSATIQATYNQGDSTGIWQHVCFTVGPGGNAFYLDGVNVPLSYDTGSAATTTWTSGFGTVNTLAIGASRIVSPDYFLGSLADSYVADCAFSASEVRDFYNETCKGYPNLFRSGRRSYATAVAGPPTYNGSAALTLANLSITGTGTYTPTYEASAALGLGSLAITGAATYTPTYEASGSLTVAALSVSGAGEYTPSVYEATAALTLGSLSLTGAATYAPLYQGTGTLTVGSLAITATATYTPLYEATGALTVAALGITGAGEYTSANIEGSGSLTVAALSITGAGEYTTPIIEATGALTVGSMSMEASAEYSTADYAGNGRLTLAGLSVVGEATYAPLYEGSGAITVASLNVLGTAGIRTGQARLDRIIRRGGAAEGTVRRSSAAERTMRRNATPAEEVLRRHAT